MAAFDDQGLQAFSEWERLSWEARAPAYAASLGDVTRGSIDALLDAAGVAAGVDVLDVGTGPGFVAAVAAGRGATVHGVDQSQAMVDIARLSGIDAVAADVRSLPFADATFDAVVAGYLLNHLPWPEQAVAELSRVLRTKGRLAMTIWDRPEANLVIGSIGAVVAEMGLTADVPVGPDPYRFTDDGQVRQLLTGWHGVSIRRVEWTVRVSPEHWFDAVADATPRTGAVLAHSSTAVRDEARRRYALQARELAASADGSPSGDVALSAMAVLMSARRA